MSKLAEILEMKRKYQEMMQKEGQKALKAEFAEFFEKNPSVKAVKWQQYTPYFNDGEPCEFSVREFYFEVDGVECESSDYDDGFFSTWSRGAPKTTVAAVRRLSEIDDEIFEACFGDHVEVTATRKGFKVEEYDHD